MFWSFAAPKGGVGVSVVAAAVAVHLSKFDAVTVVDLCGDQQWILGVDPERLGHGVFDWLSADESVSADALENLAVDVTPSLRLLPAGDLALEPKVSPARLGALVSHLSSAGPVVADVGVVGGEVSGVRPMLCATGDRTTLVVRACYMALQRARSLPVVVDDIVEVVEGGRALRTLDIESVLGQRVSSRLGFDPLISRTVDAGLMTRRLPRPLRRVILDLDADRMVQAGHR